MIIIILLNSIRDHLFSFISFCSYMGESSIPLNCWFFRCLPILSNSFCLFLRLQISCGASCLPGVNFCSKGSVEVSGAVPLISLSVCSRVALSFVCVGSLVVLGLSFLVAPLLVGSPFQLVYWY